MFFEAEYLQAPGSLKLASKRRAVSSHRRQVGQTLATLRDSTGRCSFPSQKVIHCRHRPVQMPHRPPLLVAAAFSLCSFSLVIQPPVLAFLQSSTLSCCPHSAHWLWRSFSFFSYSLLAGQPLRAQIFLRPTASWPAFPPHLLSLVVIDHLGQPWIFSHGFAVESPSPGT
jgi:hypothetical protein